MTKIRLRINVAQKMTPNAARRRLWQFLASDRIKVEPSKVNMTTVSFLSGGRLVPQ